MKNDPRFDRFQELSWRRKLSPAEQSELTAWLAAHPEVRQQHTVETALTRALATLPDVPVPSNFTSRVLSEIEREQASGIRGHSLKDWFHLRWLPRVGFAALVLLAGAVAYQREHLSLERKEYAQSIATVSEVSSMPSPEILQNFEAIRRINQVPAPDEQLLTLLQ